MLKSLRTYSLWNERRVFCVKQRIQKGNRQNQTQNFLSEIPCGKEAKGLTIKSNNISGRDCRRVGYGRKKKAVIENTTQAAGH